MIPISKVEIGEEEEALVIEVLRSGQLAQGAYVERFETLFAEAHQVRHAVAVNNGTTALVVALEALGVGPGDEVITSPFTFVATLNAILESGATARFVDIGSDYNISADRIEELVNTRTRVLLPVHLYGLMADMDEIMTIAGKHGLRVLEDSAQAVGATFEGKSSGSYDVGSFSLYATKNLCTGEGGVVTTNDDDVADRLRLLRNQGMRQRYQYEVAGHNYRLTNLAAAVGIPQLGRLQTMTARRQENAKILAEGLNDLRGVILPDVNPDRKSHVFHQFTLRVTKDATLGRDEFVARLNDSGVGCGIYYPKVVYDYDCYRSHPQVIHDEVPNALTAASEVVSIPVHPLLSMDDLKTIIRTIRGLLAHE
jgi:perosamine synthetase